MTAKTENHVKVLIVEDNIIDQLAYKSSLKKSKLPLQSKMVGSVLEAKQVLKVEKFDIAIVDYQLLDGTGFDVIPFLSNSLIIFVTGEGDLSVAVKAMKLGAFDFLAKDTKKEYLNILHQVLKKGIEKIEVTNQLRSAEIQINRLSSALSKVDNGIILSNELGEITWVNEYFIKISGYELSELQSFSNSELINKKITGLMLGSKEFETLLETKKSISFEHKNMDKKGEEYYVITTLTPMINKEGDVSEVMAVEVDISKQKEHETELLNAKIEAESSVRAKDQFLVNMSHEIRTPMNAILGMSQLLEDTRVSAIQKKYLHVINDSSNNLITIISDILDFSKINAGKIDIEKVTFNLPRSLREMKNSYTLRNSNKNVELLFEIDPGLPKLVKSDSVRISQILNNLLSNSFKFTDQGSVEVNVKMVGANNAKSWVEFSVLDTGIGISEDVLPHVFEKFTQANASITRTYGGTGIGLSIVKKLTELMNGHLTIKSALGEGTIMRVVLPLDTPENLKLVRSRMISSKISASKLNLKGIKILLVEDNKMNQMLALQYLNKQGAEVEFCENGKEATSQYLSSDYDIILMDLQMPVMGGLDATELIRSSKKDKEVQIPILAMTAHALQGDRENCLSRGMNDYISKPIKLSELKHKILSLIKGDKNNPLSAIAW
ncbi:MAG: PAS domain S-box-containing protein [Flavobacteriales bacterium]|jgi:PAS domain S-box-containing protein